MYIYILIIINPQKLQHAIEDRDEIDIQHDNVVEVR